MSNYIFVPIIKRMIEKSAELSRICSNFVFRDLRPSLPRTLNLFVNDICNSRCNMCKVWTKKQEGQFTPQELAIILDNPLFKKLESVGVSGGEPTLRNDLPEIFHVIARKKGIKGTGLITNAIEADFVIDQIDKCNNVCKAANVLFNVMVSVDGIGNVHDIIRGRAGNFDSALKVIRHVRDNTDIPLTAACTVVKENVWHLDELLDFCKEENVYARFRIAEYVNRLYNEKVNGSIRNFDDNERYQIALFFSKLELDYEKSANIRETYKNIRQMVFDKKCRQNGCPYQMNAVGLDNKGNLIFCSPKSPILGSCLENSAESVYVKNRHLRDYIIDNFCSNCIHDYHAPPTKLSLQEMEEEAYYRKQMSVKECLAKSVSLSTSTHIPTDWSHFKAPLIIGWYGTETAGDKAIIGDIIRRLKEANPGVQITIASLYPFITKRTLYELGIKKVKIIKTYSAKYLKSCRSSDAVIMGGGPLMGMEPLGFILAAFTEARRIGIPAIVEGCGIGPLRVDEHISAVKEILRLSTEIKIRDTDSLLWVKENTVRTDAVFSPDPSLSFVEYWKDKNFQDKTLPSENCFACFLREITTEYSDGMASKDFSAFRIRFEKELGKMIHYISEKTGLKPILMPMHTFVVGKDDRDFARRFAGTYLAGSNHEIGNKVYSPQDILATMKKVRFNICMRFHSVVFSAILGVPFIAIDYTGGAKIKSFLRDNKREEFKIDRICVAKGDWKEKLDNILLYEVFIKSFDKPKQ